jgi:hypothetical protein
MKSQEAEGHFAEIEEATRTRLIKLPIKLPFIFLIVDFTLFSRRICQV